MNLDKRIKDIAPVQFQHGTEIYRIPLTLDARNDVKQLIKDVLEYMKPEREGPHNKDSGWGIDDAAFNRLVDQMEAKQKELGL